MPHMSLKYGLVALIVSLAMCGCSDPNNQSYFNSETGKHVSNWLPAVHMSAANTNLSSCADCHGADFAGGISNIACGLCHMGGATSMHPAGWLHDACYNHGTYVISASTASVLGTNACANIYCHGANLQGVTGSGPSCAKCHAMPSLPLSSTCGSCHGIPPATGAHAVHTSTPLNYIVCGSCHDVDCSKHGILPALVAISPVFYAKSAGTVTYNASTCNKVSCHGGQTTPNWTSGTINVNTQCTVCHAYGTAEYNSYSSGQHYRHVLDPNNDPRPKLSCTACHDTTKLAVNHFSSLNTPAMEGPASATLLNSLNYNGTTCDPACHGQENWR
jgi:predicted CxxxxCH...CXXCH cytochrome family protein